MFITKKKISRRTVLRGAGVALALPLLDAMIPAATALAQTAAAPKPQVRRPVRAARDGAGLLGARQGGRGLRVPVQLQAARAVSEARDDPERAAFAVGRAASGRDGRGPLGGRRVPVREQAAEDRRRGRVRRHDDRSDHRAEDRRREPAAVAAARRRGSRRELEQLRRRLQLHLHEHDLLVGAVLAAADGAEPAGGVRADVRRRQHGGAAGRAPEARQQHPRLAVRQRRPPARRGRRGRQGAPGRLLRERARDRAPAADRDEGVHGRPVRHDRAGRRPADVRRAHQAAVRPAGAVVPGGHHARRHAALRARPDRAARTRRARRRPPASTASRTTARTRARSPCCRRSTSTTSRCSGT